MAVTSSEHPEPNRLKLAQIGSSVGAGMLGLGLGIAFGARLGRLALPLVVAGVLVHGWGMLERHRIERRTGARIQVWSAILYWICWIALALVASRACS